MARFIGPSVNKTSTPALNVVPTTTYTRATGITTDASNNVTSVTLGDAVYSSVLYNNVGLITSYTESIGGVSKNFVLSYDANYIVTSISQVF
jgi:hypothetical protein